MQVKALQGQVEPELGFRFPLFIYLTRVFDISALPGERDGVCQLRLVRENHRRKGRKNRISLGKTQGIPLGKIVKGN